MIALIMLPSVVLMLAFIVLVIPAIVAKDAIKGIADSRRYSKGGYDAVRAYEDKRLDKLQERLERKCR